MAVTFGGDITYGVQYEDKKMNVTFGAWGGGGGGGGGGAYVLNSTVFQSFPTSEFRFFGAKDLADSFELWHTKLFLLGLDNLRVVELQLRVAVAKLEHENF